MNRTLKKFLVALVILVSGFIAKSTFASGGTSAYEMSPASGTNTAFIAAGSGTLYDIHVTSGSINDYTVCWDSGTASGQVASGQTITPAPLVQVIVSAAATSYSMTQSGAQLAIKFVNGLVCKHSSSTVVRSIVYYIKD